MAIGNQAYNYGQAPIAQKPNTQNQQPLNGMAQNNAAQKPAWASNGPQPTQAGPQPTTQGTGWGTQQVTPGGLHGNIGGGQPQQSGGYNPSVQTINAGGQVTGGGGGPRFNASQQQRPDIGTNQEYIDTAYDSAMRQMQPQMDARNAELAQGLVNRGLQPGTEAYDAEMGRMNNMQNDMLQSAAYGAQQTGLGAQNQEFQQQFGYDQLANALQQSQIGAQAQMSAAGASANASRNNAQLRNDLGMAQLGEQSRQFDVSDIFRTQGQDQGFMLGMGNLYNQMQNTGMNQFNMQNQANNNWYQQAGQMANNAPGVNFNPQMDYTSNQIGANSNRVNAIGQDNQMMADALGGGMSMFSDKDLKENIELVDNVKGINVYEFDYINKDIGEGRYRGVMAQEVMGDYPDAVMVNDGHYMVDYSKLPVKMERVA